MDFSVNTINVHSDDKYVLFSFYKNGIPLKNVSPKWGMTLKKAGSMRFRWNEENNLRMNMFSSILNNHSSKSEFVPVELIHSQIVYDVSSVTDTFNKQGDGIITSNKNLIPVVTVADCVPIYFYDEKSKAFGVVHSGWKGTGIIGEAIKIDLEKYCGSVDDICVAIGPHIRNCCYVINEERAEYFRNNFCNDCVVKIEKDFFSRRSELANWDYGSGNLYCLSLEKANLSVLKKIGIKPENIVVAKNCTCCDEIFGSNRRETILSNNFTVQAAFIGYM